MTAPCVDETAGEKNDRAQEDSLCSLVLLVKDGDSRAELPLWESVRQFVHQQAYRALRTSGGQGGVELDDLMQAGFLAMLKAAETFDSSAGAGFLHHLSYYLRSAFANACGYRTSKRDPLDGSLSLDAPVPGGDDESDLTYADTLRDDSAEDAFIEAEDGIYTQQLHAALDAELDRLTPIKAAAIRGVYWNRKTRTQIAEEQGVSISHISAGIRHGVDDLRRGSSARRLREFVEDAVDLYSGNGLASFRRRGSGIEDAVLRRERFAEQYLTGRLRPTDEASKGPD